MWGWWTGGAGDLGDVVYHSVCVTKTLVGTPLFLPPEHVIRTVRPDDAEAIQKCSRWNQLTIERIGDYFNPRDYDT